MPRMTVEERLRQERKRNPERVRAAERASEKKRSQAKQKPAMEPTERRGEEGGRYMGITVKPGELSTPRKRDAKRRKQLGY